jgi:glycosyltransferase involved in cell wall biosynthesis
LRIAVHTDYAYHRDGDGLYAQRAFALFLNELARSVDGLVLLGRVDPTPGRARYRLDAGIEFVELPFYPSLTDPVRAVPGMVRALRRSGAAVRDVDAVWLLGPHPLGLGIALQAALRRRRIVLGVRQDLASYLRTRHPTRRWVWACGSVLERAWRAIGRRTAVVAVGPQVAGRYADARRLLDVTISLVRADEISAGSRAGLDGRERRVLSVGRLEAEKNPLLLADVLSALNTDGERWRLVVCGEGPLEGALRERVAELGVADRCDLLGYVPFGEPLTRQYHDSDLLLHVSWTEGLPQILFEAFAAGLPVVATDVGGIRAAVGEATLLIPPGDAEAAAAALRKLAADDELRTTLAARGLEAARAHTLEAESGRVAEFIGAPA